jgi:hypothetical protein
MRDPEMFPSPKPAHQRASPPEKDPHQGCPSRVDTKVFSLGYTWGKFSKNDTETKKRDEKTTPRFLVWVIPGENFQKTIPKSVMKKRHTNQYFDFDSNRFNFDSKFDLIRFNSS